MGKFDKTHAKSIGEILNSSDYNQIKVPEFQRDYSWNTTVGDHQISELWDDICQKYVEYLQDSNIQNDYLLGPMVFIENKADRIYEIVDGQQRLATLTILLCVIRDIYQELMCPISTYEFNDAQISNIYDCIGKRLVDNNGTTFKDLNWSLVLNHRDKDQFEKYIQQTKPNQFKEEIAKPNDKFRNASDKVQFLKKELKQNDTLQPSHKKIINAYIFLYEQINDALITKFGTIDNADSFLEKLQEDVEMNVEEKLRQNPELYGLPKEFFNDKNTGLDTYKNKSWDEERKKEIELELEKYNKKPNRKNKNFEEYIKNEIIKLERKNYSNNSYSSIREELIRVAKNDKIKESGKNNIFILTNFVNTLIRTKLFSVRIVVDDDEDAYEIFETVNGRGEPLSKSNMIKNYLLKQFSDKKDKDDYSKKWDKIIDAVTKYNKKPDDFLRESLISRGSEDETGKYTFQKFPIQVQSKKLVKVTKDNLYKVIKYNFEKLKDKDSDKEKELRKKYSEYYIDDILTKDLEISNILDDPINNWPKKSPNFDTAKDALTDLRNLQAIYIRLPIMCAYQKWGQDSQELSILIKFLVPFFFRYKTISDRNTTKLESHMLKICEKIKNGKNSKKDLLEVIKYLLQFNVDDESFKNNFNPRLQEPTPELAKFVLQHITIQLGNPFSDVQVVDDLHVEHILPQTPLIDSSKTIENWVKDDFFSDYDQVKHKTIKEFSSWSSRIGNLTLLHEKINTAIKNKSFKIKKTYEDPKTKKPKNYEISDLEINKQTVVKVQGTNKSRDVWTAGAIYEREVYFTELAEIIWNLPKTICSNNKCKYASGITLGGLDFEVYNDKHNIETYTCPECNNEITLKYPENQTSEIYKIPSNFSFN